MSAMNLDISVDENDWKTLPLPNIAVPSLLETFVPAQTHPLQPKANTIEPTAKPTTKTTTKTAPQQTKPQQAPPAAATFDPDQDPLRAMLNDPLAILSAKPILPTATEAQPEEVDTYAEELAQAAEQDIVIQQQQQQQQYSQYQQNHQQQQDDPRAALLLKLGRRFEFWKEKEPRILDKYTTSTTIAVDNSFLNDAKSDALGELEQALASAKKNDPTASRLEEMEYETSGAQSRAAKSYLSQKDFIKHIEEQHTKLLDAWEKGERVMALRVVIQCAKLLGDMTIPQFYPSMFVILTRILTTFGDLVFNRIREKGIEAIDPQTRQIIYEPLSASFKATDVCSSAKETCKNWFYKTTCIRELLPRLYIDMSLIKCYRFLEDESFSANLQRVCQQIRGVGDPLTASYLRAYVATKGLDITYSFHEVLPPQQQRFVLGPAYKNSVRTALQDWLLQFNHLKDTQCSSIPVVNGPNKALSPQQYFDLMAPSLEWVVQVLYYTAKDEDNVAEQEFVNYIKNVIKTHDDLILLNAVVNAYHPNFIMTHLNALLTLVHNMIEPLRNRQSEYAAVIEEELHVESSDDDDDDDSDEEEETATTKKKNNKKAQTPPPTSHTEKSQEYQDFLTLHRYVEEYATQFFDLICKKLIMYTQQPGCTLTMTSALLNALWSGICDSPYKEFYNAHSPALALLICIHGRWNDQSILLKNSLSTLQAAFKKRKNLILTNTSSTTTSTSDNGAEDVEYNNTMDSIENIFTLSPHIANLLTSDHLLAILDQLQKPQRIHMSTILLKRYKQWVLEQQKTAQKWTTNDTVLVHTLHELCSHLHSSINSLTEKVVVDEVTDLCTYAILSINYGTDVETQLSTYVSFRSVLSELPGVLRLLVHQANKLSLYALRVVTAKNKNNNNNNATSSSSNHNRKTSSFVKAAIAFCHITIPSLPHHTNSHIFERITLFLRTAETSIINNLLPQAEALITAAIQQLPLLSTTHSSKHQDTSAYRYMTTHDMSQQLTTTVQYILATLCRLPPVGGQWLRLLGILLNIMEKKSCELIDIVATPLIYVYSLSVIAVMFDKSNTTTNNNNDNNNNNNNNNASADEIAAITGAKRMIINKLLFSVKLLYSTGGGICNGLSKEENLEITTQLSNLQIKYPPQLICDTLTIVAQAFFNCMRIDPYTATIVFAIITGVKEILKSHVFSQQTIQYFITYSEQMKTNTALTPKEVKLYAGLAKKLTIFLGK